jgi:hypothetical protein
MSGGPADDRLLTVADGLPGEILVLEPMRVTALSRTGATVYTSFPLPLNALHQIRLVLGDRTLVGKARVTRAEIGEVGSDMVRYRSGLEFVDLPEHAVDVLEDFLRELRETPEDG